VPGLAVDGKRKHYGISKNRTTQRKPPLARKSRKFACITYPIVPSQILDVAVGLKYLHEQNVVHADLKAVWNQRNLEMTLSLTKCID
jgi:serine/threonine protein kinase